MFDFNVLTFFRGASIIVNAFCICLNECFVYPVIEPEVVVVSTFYQCFN